MRGGTVSLFLSNFSGQHRSFYSDNVFRIRKLENKRKIALKIFKKKTFQLEYTDIRSEYTVTLFVC